MNLRFPIIRIYYSFRRFCEWRMTMSEFSCNYILAVDKEERKIAFNFVKRNKFDAGSNFHINLRNAD